MSAAPSARRDDPPGLAALRLRRRRIVEALRRVHVQQAAMTTATQASSLHGRHRPAARSSAQPPAPKDRVNLGLWSVYDKDKPSYGAPGAPGALVQRARPARGGDKPPCPTCAPR